MRARNSGRTSLRVAALLIAAVMLPALAMAARPVVLEEVARLTTPDPAYQLTSFFALDGNDLLAAGFNPNMSPDTVLFHFERQSDGSWLSRGQITTDASSEVERLLITCKGGLCVFVAQRGNPQILERTSTGWNIMRLALSTVSDIAIQGRTLALGSEHDCFAWVHLFAKNLAGVWTNTVTLRGNGAFPDNDFLGPDVELTSDELTAANLGDLGDGNHDGRIFVFDHVNGQWMHTSTLNGLFEMLALHDDIALRLFEPNEPGDVASYFSRAPNGDFAVRHSLITDEWW